MITERVVLFVAATALILGLMYFLASVHSDFANQCRENGGNYVDGRTLACYDTNTGKRIFFQLQ